MRDFCGGLIAVFIVIYSFISVLSTFAGFLEGGSSGCEPKNYTRAAHVFPSYKLGCYLGEVPSDK